MTKDTISTLYSFITRIVSLLEEELDVLGREKSKSKIMVKKNITDVLNKLVNLIIQLNRLSKEEKFKENSIMKEEFLKDGESIWRAAKWLKINLTQDEIAAWRELRNPLAHGRFDVDIESPTEIQGKLNQAACVANIVNKFVLAIIGYEGLYRDYSTIQYPTCDFRLVV